MYLVSVNNLQVPTDFTDCEQTEDDLCVAAFLLNITEQFIGQWNRFILNLKC